MECPICGNEIKLIDFRDGQFYFCWLDDAKYVKEDLERFPINQ